MRMRCGLWTSLALAVWATPVHGSYVYIDYEANPRATLPVGVSDPANYGWVKLNAAGAGAPVINDGGRGVNAWQVTDGSTQMPNPSYVMALDSSAAAEAIRDGFQLEAYARYVSDYGGAASMGLCVHLNQRAYHFMLDLNSAGDLQATLYGRAGGPTVLTSGGTGTAGYHRFSLQSSGGASVTALFDGQPIGAGWNGVALQHENIVLWGNSNQAMTGRGVMAFHDVTFAVGRPNTTITGDADGDADVDGADFLRWQRALGSNTDLTADANGDRSVNAADLTMWRGAFGTRTLAALGGGIVPEPAATTIVGWVVAAAAITHRRSARRQAACGRRPS